MEFKKYSSIDNIRKSSEVLLYEVVCTEKLHGTSVRFFYENDGLYVGGRNKTISSPSIKEPQNDGYNFYNYISKHPIVENLKCMPALWGYTFYGEWHGPGIQQGVVYSKEKDLRIFDIRHPEGYFLNWDDVKVVCKQHRLKTVPELFRGKVKDIESLNKLLDVNSQCAIENGIKLEENIAEGIVIKPLKEMRDRRGNRIIVKYKSKKWAENAEGVSKMPKELTSEEIKLQTRARNFSECCITPGRIATIAEHLTRDGNTEISMKRTGEFLKLLMKDVIEEYNDVYSKIDKKEWKVYSKIMCSQASNLWKQYVMER